MINFLFSFLCFGTTKWMIHYLHCGRYIWNEWNSLIMFSFFQVWLCKFLRFYLVFLCYIFFHERERKISGTAHLMMRTPWSQYWNCGKHNVESLFSYPTVCQWSLYSVVPINTNNKSWCTFATMSELSFFCVCELQSCQTNS